MKFLGEGMDADADAVQGRLLSHEWLVVNFADDVLFVV